MTNFSLVTYEGHLQSFSPFNNTHNSKSIQQLYIFYFGVNFLHWCTFQYGRQDLPLLQFNCYFKFITFYIEKICEKLKKDCIHIFILFIFILLVYLTGTVHSSGPVPELTVQLIYICGPWARKRERKKERYRPCRQYYQNR